MVLATLGDSAAQPLSAASTSKSRSSTKSRTSRSSRSSGRRSKGRPRGWSCCPCPLTALSSGDPCAPLGGHEEGGLWPASAKFYCCRADLVAAMARERSNNNETPKASQAPDLDDDGVIVDYDDDDILDLDEVAEEALPDSTFQEFFNRSHQQDPDERWQIFEPDLPYVENLPHQLDAGRAIVVEGVVLPDASGFAINLTCGAGDTPDIAFHFNPRLDRNYVARNSRLKGSWAVEENAALGGIPFRRSHNFVIHILVTATCFKVSVDRMHFCNFQFRMPLSKVCRLEIHGEVTISAIRHTRLEVYPERPLEALPEHSFCSIPTDHAVPWSSDFSKENLFIGRFHPNLSPGMEITIKGRMKLLPQSFYVNLQQGCQLWPHPNVHFHLNPRFAAEDSEHVVVVNSWMRGSWGSEQRYNRCRFKPGEHFSLVIYVEDQRYRVMVNGLQQAAMFHRAPPSLVDTLVVRGDLFINHVGISKSSPPVERLPTPSSPSQSLYGSFVHIPEDMSLKSPSQASQTTNFSKEPGRDDQGASDSCPSGRGHSLSLQGSETESIASTRKDEMASICTNVYPQENNVLKEEKSVTFDDSVNAAGSGPL